MKNPACIFTVREQNRPATNVLYLDVRPHRRELRYNCHILQLPLRQFRFMQALMANHPKPMTHWEMFYRVWGEGAVNLYTDEDGGPLIPASCVQQLAAKLRIKLEPLGLMVHAPRKGYGYEIANQTGSKEGAESAEAQVGNSTHHEFQSHLPLRHTREPA